MLNPSMQDLMKNVNNRYLLVNVAAQRARDIALEAEAENRKIPDKPVKLALDEIADFKIEYREGPKPEPEVPAEIDLMAAVTASIEDNDDVELVNEADDIEEEL